MVDFQAAVAMLWIVAAQARLFEDLYFQPPLLSRADPVWNFSLAADDAPSLWFEGPFVGNGMVGCYATVHTNSTEPTLNNTVQLEISRTDVWDVRLPGTPLYRDHLYMDTPRLGVGTLALRPGGQILAGTARICLQRAEFELHLHTSLGSITLTVSAHAARAELILANMETSGTEPGKVASTWTPRVANSARGAAQPGYTPNPPAEPCVAVNATTRVCAQKLLAGGGFATAFATEVWGSYTLIAVANSIPAGVYHGQDASVLAIAALDAAAATGARDVLAEHRVWWEQYWSRSLLSVPDGVVEGFLNLQLYKVCRTNPDFSDVQIASATRAYDLMGPWFAPSRWADYHWDLVLAHTCVPHLTPQNVQMSYWVSLPANQHQLHSSLSTLVNRSFAGPVRSVPPDFQNDSAALAANTGFGLQSSCSSFLLHKNSHGACYEAPRSVQPQNDGVQLGNLGWLGHSLWMQYRYTMDERLLKQVTVPVLKRVLGYYWRLSWADSKGTIHMPYAESPEYANANDTNYDLALCRWTTETMLMLAQKTLPELQQDPDFPHWEVLSQRLAQFVVDETTGLMIGAGVQLTSGHRHWSHLFAVFPTSLLDPSNSASARQGIDHWAKLNGADRQQPIIANGFTRVATSIMSSMIPGRADQALGNITAWFDWAGAYNHHRGGGDYGVNLGPSTQYQEAFGAPCNESPLGAGFAIQSWLLASWNFLDRSSYDVLRVFPSIPSTWDEAAIGNMSAEGGYNVTARWSNHSTAWVAITSMSAPRLKTVRLYTDMTVPLVSRTVMSIASLGIEGGKNVVQFQISTGETVVLGPSGSKLPDKLVAAPVRWTDPRTINWWGKHQRPQ